MYMQGKCILMCVNKYVYEIHLNINLKPICLLSTMISYYAVTCLLSKICHVYRTEFY